MKTGTTTTEQADESRLVIRTSFTPGPWDQNFDEQHYLPHEPIRVGSFDEGRFRVVCEMDHVCTDDAEAEANARLIAAAPTMFEALKALVHRNGGLAVSDEMKQALAALAKAGWQSPSEKFEADLSAIKEAIR